MAAKFNPGDKVMQHEESEFKEHNFPGEVMTVKTCYSNNITFEETGKAVHMASRFSNCYTGDTIDTAGAKYDKGKLLFGLLTRGLALPLRSVAAVLTYGAQKYAPESWKTVPQAKERYEDALDRHLNAWKSGEEFDAESGLHHLSHVACNVLFLLWFVMQNEPRSFTNYNEVKNAK